MARSIEIQFPSGVNRRLGYRVGATGRREYFSPWSCNVRLEGSIHSRLRGGSFVARPASSTLAYLITEDGVHITTEDGMAILASIEPVRDYVHCVYRDRLCKVSDHIIQVSRIGDHADFTYSSDISDKLRPALFQLSEADEIGDIVKALVPHKDAHMLCFTDFSTWVMSGDPVSASLRNVSREVGIVGERAWCKNHDTVYFLSPHGLYSVGADGSGLTPLSEDVLPEDLTGVSDEDCVLDYHHADRGVYIHKTGQDWFYDTARNQFWPFDRSTTDSHLLIGPIKLGSTDMLGLIQTMHGIIAQSSGTVTWSIIRGDTAEEAADDGKAAITAALAGSDYSSYVRESGSWSADRSYTSRPRVSGMWAVIWLQSSSAWSFEGLSLGIEPVGNWRK